MPTYGERESIAGSAVCITVNIARTRRCPSALFNTFFTSRTPHAGMFVLAKNTILLIACFGGSLPPAYVGRQASTAVGGTRYYTPWSDFCSSIIAQLLNDEEFASIEFGPKISRRYRVTFKRCPFRRHSHSFCCQAIDYSYESRPSRGVPLYVGSSTTTAAIRTTAVGYVGRKEQKSKEKKLYNTRLY